jgi:hypothetical protein
MSGVGGLGLGTSGLATSIIATTTGTGPSSAYASSRPRQNSVFVTSLNSPAGMGMMAVNGMSVFKNTSRKTKSAIDLSTLVLSEEFIENVRRNSKNSITHL